MIDHLKLAFQVTEKKIQPVSERTDEETSSNTSSDCTNFRKRLPIDAELPEKFNSTYKTQIPIQRGRKIFRRIGYSQLVTSCIEKSRLINKSMRPPRGAI